LRVPTNDHRDAHGQFCIGYDIDLVIEYRCLILVIDLYWLLVGTPTTAKSKPAPQKESQSVKLIIDIRFEYFGHGEIVDLVEIV